MIYRYKQKQQKTEHCVYSDDLEVDVEPILEYVLKNGTRVTDELDRRLRLLTDDFAKMPKTILRLLEQYTQK